MTDYNYPLPSVSEFAERVTTFPDGVSSHRWVLRDDNEQHYHGRVSLAEDPSYIELHWKPDARGREQLVGRYRLHLARLVEDGYARLEDAGAAPKEARVRFYRGDRGTVFIQVRLDSPALRIGTVDTSLG